jgi:hypothetical protein
MEEETWNPIEVRDLMTRAASGIDPEETTLWANPGGQIMVRYFYAWTPLVIVGTVVLLSLPWLGLIALMIFALVALAALAWTIVFVPLKLSRAISRRWHLRRSASLRTAAALSPAERQDA